MRQSTKYESTLQLTLKNKVLWMKLYNKVLSDILTEYD